MSSSQKTPKLEVLYRPSEAYRRIHETTCKHCPTAHGMRDNNHDPESLVVKAADRETQLRSLFLCAWRPTALCKGYCDFMEVSEEDLTDYTGEEL